MEGLASFALSVLTGMTSRPMPSPGNRPIRNDLEAILRGQSYYCKVQTEKFQDL